jgi:hypothetical protein
VTTERKDVCAIREDARRAASSSAPCGCEHPPVPDPRRSWRAAPGLLEVSAAAAVLVARRSASGPPLSTRAAARQRLVPLPMELLCRDRVTGALPAVAERRFCAA